MRSYVYQEMDGIRRTVFFDEDDPNTFSTNVEMDAEPIVETNRVLQELHPVKSTNKLIARVPMTVYEQSIHENWDEDKWKKWLNDPDNAAFRIWKGRV